jgi:cysteine-rich repeat protein
MTPGCGGDEVTGSAGMSTSVGSSGQVQTTTTAPPTSSPTGPETTDVSTTSGVSATMASNPTFPETTTITSGGVGTTDEATDTGAASTGAEPFCGDGVVDPGEECDEGDGNGPGRLCNAMCRLNICGDGDLSPAEQCDDGADNSDMGSCKPDCTNNVCGDGKVGPGEGCDDGNMIDDDVCGNDCALTSCGDGKVAPTEQCDDGNKDNTDACTQACTNAVCSDGFTQPSNLEECDDGVDNADSAACTAACTKNVCGDGALFNTGVGTEQCDNGANNGPGKSCSATCTLNVCGDGDKGPGEECDDGGKMAGDGCSASCKLEQCGNSILDPGEFCDDGANGDNDDGCTDACKAPVCGDGLQQPSLGEQCDQGGSNSNTGVCTLTCKNAVCGDGLIQQGVEQCDDGVNNGAGKACKANCSKNVCGDGDKGPGEACDDGNQSNDDACTNVCKLASCGDGFKQPGEQCDSGVNNSNTGACTLSCKLPVCGDTFVQAGEQCDDGNLSDTDACISCKNAVCGDGKVYQGQEQCDDGNASNNDLCTNTCKTATCSDAFKNGAETDVDCGGPTCNKCELAKQCLVPGDCLSGSCINGKCSDPTSCKVIKQNNPAAQSGVYLIDPDGAGGQAAFLARCDMVADGGGWTLIGSQVNPDGRNWTSLAVHTNLAVLGDVNTFTTADYKNVGWTTLPARNLMLRTEEYAVAWTNNVLTDTAFGPWITGKYNVNACSTGFVGGTPAYGENITASQRLAFDINVRALDNNCACYPGCNENALVTFTLQSCCWTMGIGNTPAGQATWSGHDQSLLKLSSLVSQACDPAVYPCNPQGYWNAGTPCYDTSCKTNYSSVWVR